MDCLMKHEKWLRLAALHSNDKATNCNTAAVALAANNATAATDDDKRTRSNALQCNRSSECCRFGRVVFALRAPSARCDCVQFVTRN